MPAACGLATCERSNCLHVSRDFHLMRPHPLRMLAREHVADAPGAQLVRHAVLQVAASRRTWPLKRSPAGC